MPDKVAERWKIEAVLALVRAVPYERFVIAGLGNPQGKTRRFMQLVGFGGRQVHETVCGLRVSDYSAGPLPDDKGRPHDVWVFGTYVPAFEVYVKLAVFSSSGSAQAVCVSFHEAEYRLSYPYRREVPKLV